MKLHRCACLSLTLGGLLLTGVAAAAPQVVVARDGQSQLTLADGWLDLRDLTHPTAQLQIGSRLLNQYTIVLREPHQPDLPDAEFMRIATDFLASGLDQVQVTPRGSVDIGPLKGQVVEVIGMNRETGSRVGYLLTGVRTARNDFQIVGWCRGEEFPQLKPLLLAVAQTFRELPAR